MSVHFMCVCMLSCFSCIQLFVTPWTVPLQAPLSMGFSRQEYQGGLPFPSQGSLLYAATELRPPALLGDSLLPELPGKPGVGSHSLLQGIFLTQGLNQLHLCLLYWQAACLPQDHLGSPVQSTHRIK